MKKQQKTLLLAMPEKEGYSRDFSWCSKCGAPKWVEWPKGIERDKNIGLVKICEPTCECRVGWHTGSVNLTLAKNAPPGWHCRLLVGITDTPNDIKGYYVKRIANALESAFDEIDNAGDECELIRNNVSIDRADEYMRKALGILNRLINGLKEGE